MSDESANFSAVAAAAPPGGASLEPAPTGAARTGLLEPGALVLERRFRVVRLLGSGGMGQVYLAEQVSLGRSVALKVLRKELTLVPGMAERFRREALLLSSVDHPAVVRVIDFGYSTEAACLVMELAEGQTLDAALREGPMSVERGLRLLVQLAEGLAAIHHQGIVHRDLKPENVLLTRAARGEQAKLLDFGIARLAQPEVGSSTTQAGMVLGTPEYIAPEQASGGAVEARTDLYSFGVMAFRTLSGALPFPGPSPREFLFQHLSAQPARLEAVTPRLARAPELCRLIAACLEKDPSRRPASAAALGAELAALAELPARPPLPQHPIPLTDAVQVPTPAPRALSGSLSGPFAAHARPQNLAVMLTDIKGFTARTSNQTLEENARMLEEHDGLLLPLLRRFRGKLVQKRGDALLATFFSPTECVLCGMAMQDRLWRHNAAAAPERQLHVRVAIHLGEVALTRDGLIGEPAQVVAAVESLAEAGEVVFTESVRLSMNRNEVNAEARGQVDVPGRGEKMNLYRCVPQAGGPPFGGRDLQAGRARISELLSAVWVRVRPLALRFSRRVASATRQLPVPGPRHYRGLGFAAVACVVLLGGGLIVHRLLQTPARVARRQVRDGDWTAALATVQGARVEGDAAPELSLLEAQALHQLKRHAEEWSALTRLEPVQLELLDEVTLTGVVEDFSRNERERALRELLDRLPGAQLVELAKGHAVAAQWGALRYLDAAQVPGAELVEGYLIALDSQGCRIRRVAAWRLGQLGDPRAIGGLEALKATPKKPGFPFDENCGQDEAAGALRRLSKKR
ncbi:MAG: protein kinase domain-containing protein [Myxococcaceae bacterium]